MPSRPLRSDSLIGVVKPATLPKTMYALARIVAAPIGAARTDDDVGVSVAVEVSRAAYRRAGSIVDRDSIDAEAVAAVER